MTNGHLGGIVRHLKSLLGAENARTATDGELLQRFARHQDEGAFAALVERYSSLVAGVCRRTCSNDHDAEDVFQATFLVLVRKAGSLDGRGTVANWLYTVAYHLALKARARTGQRRAHERQVANMPEVETATEPLWNELRPLIDEELNRLPDKYRSPMVLCYLTGKTNEQAAQELGWTKDTVRGRLARGREMLRDRLARRGVTLAGAVLATVLTENASRAAVPAVWIDATLKAGALFAAGQTAASGISASVLALVHAGLHEVFFAKLKIAAVLCLIAGVAGTGVGMATLNRGEAPASHSRAAHLLRGNAAAAPIDTSTPQPDEMEMEMTDELPMEEAVTEFPLNPADPPPIPDVTIKRRDWACEGELQKQLLAVPEVSLDAGKGSETSEWVLEHARRLPASTTPHYVLDVVSTRGDLAGLPMRTGADCQLVGQPAQELSSLSRELRAVLVELVAPRRRDEALDPSLVPVALWKNLQDRTRTVSQENQRSPIFQKPGAVATLIQMLTAEESGVRRVLAQQLMLFEHPAATEALARLAIFDLAPEVRAAAVAALASRPRGEYRNILLGGFRYPWAPVADHAAEAIVALNDRDAVPALRALARETDPSAPDRTNEPSIREVVRINHLRNCLLCHAPSQSGNDLVRGLIPTPGRPLPPPISYYGSDMAGEFVRADITYLRQDFSVKQPVVKTKDDPWPDRQRYDYLVRTRPLTVEEGITRSQRPEPRSSPQREAVLYTLRELTSR